MKNNGWRNDKLLSAGLSILSVSTSNLTRRKSFRIGKNTLFRKVLMINFSEQGTFSSFSYSCNGFKKEIIFFGEKENCEVLYENYKEKIHSQNRNVLIPYLIPWSL